MLHKNNILYSYCAPQYECIFIYKTTEVLHYDQFMSERVN